MALSSSTPDVAPNDRLWFLNDEQFKAMVINELKVDERHLEVVSDKLARTLKGFIESESLKKIFFQLEATNQIDLKIEMHLSLIKLISGLLNCHSVLQLVFPQYSKGMLSFNEFTSNLNKTVNYIPPEIDAMIKMANLSSSASSSSTSSSLS